MALGKPVLDKQAIGVEVSWSFGRGECDSVAIPRVSVRELMISLGFAKFVPSAMYAQDALRMAVRFAPTRDGLITKRIADEPNSWGVYRRLVGKGEAGGDGWILGAKVSAPGKLVTTFQADDTDSGACLHVANNIAGHARLSVACVLNSELSATIVQVGNALGWIPRRPAGGVYLVLAEDDAAERMIALLRGLAGETRTEEKENQFRPQIQEVYAKPLSNASWAASVEDVIEHRIVELQRALDRMLEEEVKTRESTKRNRMEDAETAIALAEKYRFLLSDAASGLQSRLRKIHSRFQSSLKKADGVFDHVDGRRPVARRAS